MLWLYIMVASFTALQLFSAHRKLYRYIHLSVNSHFTVSYNISLYRDTKAAIYRYTQMVYRYTSSIWLELIQTGQVGRVIGKQTTLIVL